MDILRSMSDAAYENIKDSDEDVLNQLVNALTRWDELVRGAQSPDDDDDDKESRPPTNPYKTLMGQLYGWMHQLPLIGFNSGKYDLNAVKQFLIPYFLSTSKTEEQEQEDEEEKEQEGKEKEEENDGVGSFFVIKRNNTFMCLLTDLLKFLNMTKFIAPGFSYDKYLKAYGCEVTKGHFPYEYMDCLRRLDDTALPSKDAFFNRLKNEGISEEDYIGCQEAWRENGMTTLRYFLVRYKNRDVVPFLQAIDRQFIFYQQRGTDMLKQGISIPGLTLLYLFNDLPENTYFTLFNEKNKDLHYLVNNHIVGGASLIFHRYHEKGSPLKTGTERPLVLVDRLSATMPTRCTCGVSYKTCRWGGTSDDGKRTTSGPNRSEQRYRQMAAEWLTWEAERTGLSIRHQVSGREKKIDKLPVDGWCSTTKTAYQFHKCLYHGYPCLALETNAVNGKPMTQLLAETRKNTAYLCHFGKVVQLWECE